MLIILLSGFAVTSIGVFSDSIPLCLLGVVNFLLGLIISIQDVVEAIDNAGIEIAKEIKDS